jgi:hypothetical protein
MTDQSIEVTVLVSSVKFRRITHGATEFDWFKRVGVVEWKKFSEKVGPLRSGPEMKQKEAGVEGTASVREATGFNGGGAGTQIKN